MPNVTFRAKVESVYNPDGESVAFRMFKVPAIKRAHCDMDAFRRHARFGPYANSDMFPGLLRRQLAEQGIKETIRMDRLPACVSVDESGFLARVTIDLP